MSMHRSGKKCGWVVITGGLCVLGLIGWAALAQSDVGEKRNPIAERQELMKNTGANFKDMSQKAKDGQYARMMVNAHTIAINTRHIPMLFPKGSMGTPEMESRAKPEIWQDWNGFTSAAQKARDAAMAMVELTKNAEQSAVSGEEIDGALKTLGEACKNCHKKFRQPKKDNS